MSDNTTLVPGGGGDTIRTLDKTGTGSPKTEVVALDLGGGDGRSESVGSYPLPASLADVPTDDDGNPVFSLSDSSKDAIEMLFRQLMAAISTAQGTYPITVAEVAVGLTSSALNLNYPAGNVFRYGAKGDSVTNDAVAIQAAIRQSASPSPSAVPAYMPGGQYYLGSTGLLLPYGSSLIGSGAPNTALTLGAGGTIALDGYGAFPVISGITQSNPAVITLSTVSTTHPLAQYLGCIVVPANIVGMTQMNGLALIITGLGGSSGAWNVTVLRDSTPFSAYVSGGNLVSSGSFAYLSNFYVNVAVTNGIAMRFGNVSQNIRADRVICVYTGGASVTGAGCLLNGTGSGEYSGFSNFSSCYWEGFHFGLQFLNGASNAKWTTVNFRGCQLLGDSAAGSIGIWEDSNSDNVGSIFWGGTIENFAKPWQLDSGSSKGMRIEADVEGNTNTGTMFANASFEHRTEWSTGTEAGWWWQDAPPNGSQIYARYKQQIGALIEEQYGNRDLVALSDSGVAIRCAIRAGASLINGGSPSFVGGVSVTPSGLTNPANNWMYAANGSNKICWGSAVPTGGTWAQGDICILTGAATNSPQFGVCTVAGTPGTWVNMVLMPSNWTWNATNNVSVAAPASGLAVQVFGAGGSNTYAVQINGSTAASSRGLLILGGAAGTTDHALTVNDGASTVNLFIQRGDRSFVLGGGATNILTGATGGQVTIAVPTTAGAALTLPAGTATIEPLLLTAGTNLTTTAAGIVEYDGTCEYFTPFATNRSVVMTEAVQCISGAYTLASQTAAQKLLNATATGAITLPIGVYEFECAFTLTAMSASTGAFGFAIGGSSTHTDAWWCSADKLATLATAAATAFSSYNTAANVAISPSNTLTTGWAKIRGIIRVTVAGTIIPQVSLGVAAAAVVGANSFFRILPVGPSGFTTVGQWT